MYVFGFLGGNLGEKELKNESGTVGVGKGRRF